MGPKWEEIEWIFFSVPGLDQSKQATDEAKSPYTCHNPRSSRSLLALSVWVPIVLTRWKTTPDLQRRTRFFFPCHLDTALRIHLWLWLILNSNHATTLAGREGTDSVFGSSRRTQFTFIHNRPLHLMGNAEQRCAWGSTFTRPSLQVISPCLLFMLPSSSTERFLKKKNGRHFYGEKKVSSGILRLLTTPSMKVKPWTI